MLFRERIRALSIDGIILKIVNFFELNFIKAARNAFLKNEKQGIAAFSVLGFSCLVFSLIFFTNDFYFFSIFFTKNTEYANLIFKVGLLILLISILGYRFEKSMLITVIMVHVLLLYFYNRCSNPFAIYRLNIPIILSFILSYIWWLSLGYSLKYLHLAAKKQEISRQYYLTLLLFVFWVIKYIREGGFINGTN